MQREKKELECERNGRNLDKSETPKKKKKKIETISKSSGIMNKKDFWV